MPPELFTPSEFLIWFHGWSLITVFYKTEKTYWKLDEKEWTKSPKALCQKLWSMSLLQIASRMTHTFHFPPRTHIAIVTSYVSNSFYSGYSGANSFMSTILTFILFFVYFPLRGRKPYLSALAGINAEAGSRKIYYWDLFARAPSTDIATAKVMNDTCFEILPVVNPVEENSAVWEVYLSWNMWEFYGSGRGFYNTSNFLTFLSVLRSHKVEGNIP